MEKDYHDLVSFWNRSFILNDENKEEILKTEGIKDSWKELSPSDKLNDALKRFKGKEKILDYGCGNGWASIVMAKDGIKNIDACDVAINSIRLLDFYKELFDVKDAINSFAINSNWLGAQKEETYDGFYSSNVIDVVSLEMAKDIIKDAARITKKGAIVIFSLNYYIDPQIMQNKGCEVKNNQIYIDGVLRLTSLTDDEWKNEFAKYFNDIELSYFSWPGEQKESRRLFIMKK